MRRPIKRFICCTLLICALAPAVQNACAQDMLRAAAVVNDEVISMFDLDMRLRLAILAPRKTVDRFGQNTEISTKGRHDRPAGR